MDNSSKRRLKLLQSLSAELARGSDDQPPLVDIVELLERARSGTGAKLTLPQKKLAYAAHHCLSTVYFLAAVDSGLIKIGKTTDLKKRMAVLAGSSPVPLTLVCTIDYDDELEKRIHRHLHDYHSHGEWFFADEPVLDFIRGYKANGIRWVVERVGEAPRLWMNNRGVMPQGMKDLLLIEGIDPIML